MAGKARPFGRKRPNRETCEAANEIARASSVLVQTPSTRTSYSNSTEWTRILEGFYTESIPVKLVFNPCHLRVISESRPNAFPWTRTPIPSPDAMQPPTLAVQNSPRKAR